MYASATSTPLAPASITDNAGARVHPTRTLSATDCVETIRYPCVQPLSCNHATSLVHANVHQDIKASADEAVTQIVARGGDNVVVNVDVPQPPAASTD
jgi:hypothetical protein